MTPEQIDRVFGRGRLKMVTGEHVEVFREAVVPGERRRYTKRFLNTTEGDFAHWTEREWRILARLIGHGIGCVPEVVQFDRGSGAGTQLVQTYDAGVTVDQWATLLPLLRDGQVYRHVFEDCAHWWALAHHCLVALNEIHQLQLVHLDIKGDNVCIPLGPASFDPDAPGLRLYPIFGQIALIDFAFALVSRESLTTPLPIGWQREYDYQSPRLLKALEDGRNADLRRTRELDWRCDIYSLAAMLKRYLPDEAMVHQPERATGWTSERYDAAKALILTLRDHHDRDASQLYPHQELIDTTGARLREGELTQSLAAGWTLARDVAIAPSGASPLTPMTRLAPPIRVFVSPRVPALRSKRDAVVAPRDTIVPLLITKRNDVARPPARSADVRYAALISAVLLAFGMVVAQSIFPDATFTALEGARTWLDSMVAQIGPVPPAGDPAKSNSAPNAPETGTEQVAEAPQSAAPSPAETPQSAAPTPAEAPPAATAPEQEPATQSAEPDNPVAESLAKGNAESSGAAVPPTRKPEAAAPSPRSRTRAKVAVTANDAARAPDKRLLAKSPRIALARPSKSMATAKSPPASVSRFAAKARGTVATTPESQSMVSPLSSPQQAPRVEPAPVAIQLAQAPLSGQPITLGSPSPAAQQPLPTPVMPPSPSEAPPPTQVTPSSSPATDQATKASSAHAARTPPAPISPPAARPQRAPLARDDRHAEVGLLSRIFQLARRTPAPIEDRRSPATERPDQSLGAQQTPSLPQERVAQASPKVNVPTSAQPTISSMDPGVSASRDASQTAASRPPATSEGQDLQSRPTVDEKRSLPPPPARIEAKPWRPEEARPGVPPAWTPPPRVLPPLQAMPASPAESLSSDRTRENDYAVHARRMLAQAVPRMAVQTQSEIARVLWTAANAYDPRQERTVSEAAQAVWVRNDPSGLSPTVEAGEARRLNDEALRAYWSRRNVAEAFDLQLKAFGANPHDPEIAGNLALLHLRVSPSHPEMARQLALHAIAVRGARYPTGRLEDWNTYAVASALTGRDADARNALFVTVALAGNVDRNCRAGLIAIASYGEAVRESVKAMLYRIHTQGRAHESPYCTWPPNWSAAARSQ